MTDAEQLIRRIHNAGKQFVLAVTGGGSGAIASLLRVPGGSRSLLEARVPYSEASLIDLLGSRPEQFCSDRTARNMAMACWQRARRLAGDVDPDRLIGLACTASLASDRPKRGAHRAYLAAQTTWQTRTTSIELTRDARTRGEEEDVTAVLALCLAAKAAGIEEALPLPLLPGEQVVEQTTQARPQWRELLLGQTLAVVEGQPYRRGDAVFPGAFNPLHEGHRGMADVARRHGLAVHYELSIENVDKPWLDYQEMESRCAQFPGETLWLTRAPTFVEKSRLFPGAVFIVGADTLLRIGQARYYGDDPAACEAAINEIARNGCRFLVFARADQTGLHTVADLEIPASLRALCEAVSPQEFREDISSTALRAAQQHEGSPEN